MITLAFESPETRDGKSPGEAARMLEGAGADVVGANCWQDPTFMLPAIEQMREAVNCHVAAQPVAYRCTPEVPFFTGQPGFPDRLDDYKISRYEMGDFAKDSPRPGRELYWRLLRLRGIAHPPDGARHRQGAR